MTRRPGHEHCPSCPTCGLTNYPDCDGEGQACQIIHAWAEEATPLSRPAPALSTLAQEVVNLAVDQGLYPLIRDVQGESFTVALLPTGDAVASSAVFFLALSVADQDDDPALLAPTGPERVCSGWEDIRTALTEAYQVRSGFRAADDRLAGLAAVIKEGTAR